MIGADSSIPSGARAVARCDALGVAPYSDMEGGLYRGYLTPAHRAAIDRVAAWMVEAVDVYIYLRDEYPHIR